MIVSVSRNASIKCKNFAIDLSKSIPKAQYFSRGKKPLGKLIEKARFEGKKFLLIVSEQKGIPKEIIGIRIEENNWSHFFSAKLRVLKFRKEFGSFKGKISELNLEIKSPAIKKLFSLLEIESEKESGFSLQEKNSIISFFAEKKEFGPKFEVGEIKFE